MKKLLTLALAVLGISAAQALTYGWTSWTPNQQVTKDASFNSTVSLGDVTYTADNAAASNYKTEALAANQKFSITSLAVAVWSTSGGKWSGDAAKIGLAILDANNKIMAVSSSTNYMFGGATSYHSSVQAFPTTGNKAYVSFNFNEGDFEATTSDTFYVAFIATSDYGQGVSGLTVGDTLATNSSLLYTQNNGDICNNGGAGLTFRVTTESVVPEPTVLALLALGVAGVALRRKKVVA